MDMQSRQVRNCLRENRTIAAAVAKVRVVVHDEMDDHTAETIFDQANAVILAELKRSKVSEVYSLSMQERL